MATYDNDLSKLYSELERITQRQIDFNKDCKTMIREIRATKSGDTHSYSTATVSNLLLIKQGGH